MVSIIDLKKRGTGCRWSWSVYYPITEQVIDYQTNWYGEGIYQVSPRPHQVEGDCEFILRGISTYSGAYKKVRKYFESASDLKQVFLSGSTHAKSLSRDQLQKDLTSYDTSSIYEEVIK